MSSNEYSADISPDPKLRQVLVWSGAVLGLVGAGLIVMLPVQGPLRGLLVLAWSASVLHEILILRRAWARSGRRTGAR